MTAANIDADGNTSLGRDPIGRAVIQLDIDFLVAKPMPANCRHRHEPTVTIGLGQPMSRRDPAA
jgi:hypothetical protein